MSFPGVEQMWQTAERCILDLGTTETDSVPVYVLWEVSLVALALLAELAEIKFRNMPCQSGGR